ncbi:hypothetical protein BC628DRAFT_1368468 [Trametes gibbosa]|nr:hypothetical protein BC628DRAFT_1368468 [Trametes gibbosa]
MDRLHSRSLSPGNRRFASRQESSADLSPVSSATGSSASVSAESPAEATSTDATDLLPLPQSSPTMTVHDRFPAPPLDMTTTEALSSTMSAASTSSGSAPPNTSTTQSRSTKAILPNPVNTFRGITVTISGGPSVTTMYNTPPNNDGGGEGITISNLPVPFKSVMFDPGEVPHPQITSPDSAASPGPPSTSKSVSTLIPLSTSTVASSSSSTWPGDSETSHTWPGTLSTSGTPTSATSQVRESSGEVLPSMATSLPRSTESVYTNSVSWTTISTGAGPTSSSFNLSSFPLATPASQTSPRSRSLDPTDIATICVSVLSAVGLSLVLLYMCRRWRRKRARTPASGPHDSFYGESIVGLRVSMDGMSMSSADQREPRATSMNVRASSGTYNFPLPPSYDHRHDSKRTPSANSLTVLIPARNTLRPSNRSSAVSQDTIPIPYSAYENAVKPTDWVDMWNIPRASSELMQHYDLSRTSASLEDVVGDPTDDDGPVVAI